MSLNQFVERDIREPVLLAMDLDWRLAQMQVQLKWSHIWMKLANSVCYDGEFVEHADYLAIVCS
jgi:hypothetical protein